jgi:hypothetical protein
LNNFLDLLFAKDAMTCYTESPFGYKVKSRPYPEDLFFCINELHPLNDLNPTKSWHDKWLPRRADCNVVCFKNFLIEIDTMPLTEQISYVRSRIPVSSIVYSGGSSYHFIISLETPVKTYEEYMNISKRLLLLLTEADPACKNPSRLSRLPGRVRPETDKMQELVYLGAHVNNEVLLSKLPELPVFAPKTYSKDERKMFVNSSILEAIHAPESVMEKIGLGRNALFFWLHNRFEDNELPYDKRVKFVETAYNNLKDTQDFSFEEACAAARIEG